MEMLSSQSRKQKLRDTQFRLQVIIDSISIWMIEKVMGCLGKNIFKNITIIDYYVYN